MGKVVYFDVVTLFIFVAILWTLQWQFTLWPSAWRLQYLFIWECVKSQCICTLPYLEQFTN